MERKTARDFHPEVLHWFNLYVHGQVDRRGFLNGVAKYAVGGVTAAMLLESLRPKYAEAQQIAKNDKRIKTRFVEFPSPEGYGMVRAYLASPANASGKLPGILVVHENRGLNPHMEDIARRSPGTASTTIRRRATIPRQRIWRGRGRSTSSTRICGRSD